MADPLMAQQAAPMSAEEPVSEQEQATFEQIVAGLLDYIHDPNHRKSIIEQLRSGESPAQAAGQIVLLLIQEASKQADAAQQETDMGMLLDAAAEVIDALLAMAKAAKVRVADDDDFRAEAMLTAIQSYISMQPPGSEEQEAAKQLLAQMQASGQVEEGAAALQQIGAKHGVDPFAQAAPQQTPMAQGVRAGLMGS